MLPTLIELVVAPALVAAATVVARRWGARAGGVVSAFPAIVGPVLLVTALEHGSAFSARAANGTLVGLVSLSGFALAYGRVATAHSWLSSLAAGWLCAGWAALAVASFAGGAAAPAGLLLAIGSLALAHRGLRPTVKIDAPHATQLPADAARPRNDLPLRMALTALLVFSLASAAALLGPLVGGILSALPVLASLLAVFTHRQHGATAAATLLRGTLLGMAGFVAFVQVVAWLIVPDGIVAAFLAATLIALAVQTLTIRRPAWSHAVPSRHDHLPEPASG